jgi:hypothetical protein
MSDAQLTPEASADLLLAITKLSAAVRPVTADTLAECEQPDRGRRLVRLYAKVALCLAIIIVPMSIITFATSSISEAIMRDIDTANALAVKLSDEIGPPGRSPPPDDMRIDPATLPHGVRESDLIRDLQTFAATIRLVDARTHQLNLFLWPFMEADPFEKERTGPNKNEEMRRIFELPPDLPVLSDALRNRIFYYQDVRHVAQTVRERISTLYGAIAAGILPLLYALLGACAYLLRTFQEQFKTRAFTGKDMHVSRFVIAAIGGGVIGLFKNFTSGDGASVSPLAIAFLVGYAADVFFSFLDSLVHTFSRSPPANAAKSAG